MKTVAIWAPLRFTNYGDDMQALAFAIYIRSLGYRPRLYQLDKSLASLYKLETVDTIEELCKDVRLCIIAGGGLLSPFNFLRRTLNPTYAEYELMFKDLCKAINQYHTIFCAISMGGDGILHSPFMMYGKWRRRLFSSPNFINGTVRLTGDSEQMQAYYRKAFEYYPDMLFKSPDYFEPQLLERSKKKRIALNFKKNRNYKYLDRHLLDDIIAYAKSHDDLEFHFITTHMESSGQDYQYVPDEESDNLRIDHYTSPNQLLGVLASCELLVTSMLHPGLTGLSIGTPFLSYRGPGKTKSFLKSVGGEWAIIDDHITFDTLKETYFSKGKSEVYHKYDVEALGRMKNESSRHYDFCKEIVEQYA